MQSQHSYKRKAAIPAKTAPKDRDLATAPPVKLGGLAVEVGDVPLPPVALPPVRVKLAQVRRVALLVWMTMERLPKKAPRAELVEA